MREKAYGPSSGGRVGFGNTTGGPLKTGTASDPRAGIGRFAGRFTATGRAVTPLPSRISCTDFTHEAERQQKEDVQLNSTLTYL